MPDRVCADLAQRIIELRKQRGWSQEHLAERANIDARNLRRIEAEGNARVWTLAHLAQGLGVAMEDLFQPPRASYERVPGRPHRGAKPGKQARGSEGAKRAR
jgi:transcriptional regulator with XRE-family HTH domain